MVTPTITKTPPAQRNGASLPREYDPAYLSVAYPPNEEPMADPIRLREYMKQLQLPLEELFDDDRTLVMSNVFLYYRMGDPTKVVAPDLMVAFGLNIGPISRAKSYHTWLPGKPPALVMEVGSDSTYNRDLYVKPAIYAEIGAGEYWLIDPPAGERYGFILKGLRLVNGEYQEIPMERGEGDDIRGYSAALGLFICWENGAIRYFNPATGEYLKNQDETIAALATAIAERDAAQAERDAAQAENRRLLALLAEREQ